MVEGPKPNPQPSTAALSPKPPERGSGHQFTTREKGWSENILSVVKVCTSMLLGSGPGAVTMIGRAALETSVAVRVQVLKFRLNEIVSIPSAVLLFPVSPL